MVKTGQATKHRQKKGKMHGSVSMSSTVHGNICAGV